MFTGIVEELGKIKSIKKGSTEFVLGIAAPSLTPDLNIGDSVAVNGICLTVTSKTGGGFTVDVMEETVKKTNLDSLKPGSSVNLERALTLASRLGGHMVSGHVDGVGAIRSKTKKHNALLIAIDAPRAVTRYLIDRGSIAVDGISLTVMDFGDDFLAVSIIPHTAKLTTLGAKEKGDTVNLEADLIGKYVERFLDRAATGRETNKADRKESAKEDGIGEAENRSQSSGRRGLGGGLTIDKLRDSGFM